VYKAKLKIYTYRTHRATRRTSVERGKTSLRTSRCRQAGKCIINEASHSHYFESGMIYTGPKLYAYEAKLHIFIYRTHRLRDRVGADRRVSVLLFETSCGRVSYSRDEMDVL